MGLWSGSYDVAVVQNSHILSRIVHREHHLVYKRLKKLPSFYALLSSFHRARTIMFLSKIYMAHDIPR
jgi:hypothetical protein